MRASCRNRLLPQYNRRLSSKAKRCCMCNEMASSLGCWQPLIPFAQADVGIAMGVMGTDIALEAAHAALMREDWNLVPDLFTIAKRTIRVVKMNLSFTILYNLVGLSLAAFGILPPILAAAAHSLPDLGILANSSRLLRQKLPNTSFIPPTGVEQSDPVLIEGQEGCGCGKEGCCGECDHTYSYCG